MAATQPPAMFEDEIVIEEVYIPPQYEEILLNSEGDGLKSIKVKVIRGHTDCITSATFCSNDNQVITSSNDGTVRLWDKEDGREVYKYDNLHAPGANISKCAISLDNNRIISAGWDKKIKLTDAETGIFLWVGEHRGIVTDCNFSHDGRLVVSCSDLDKSIKLWDSISGDLIKNVEGMHDSTITKCTFDIKDVRLISTSMDKTCKIWDMKSEVNTITLSAHDSIVSNMAYTENGQLLATCGWDKVIYLWDITTGMYRTNGPRCLEKHHEGSISSVAFSRDGGLLVSGSYDRNILVWDTTEHNIKLKLQGHEDWVTDVGINNGGDWILSASKDTTIRLWNIAESDKITATANDTKKTIGLRVSTCANCKKPFSVAMLDESKETGQNLCVFCRMDQRPTIWSVVEDILNTENMDEEDEQEEQEEEKPST